MKKITSRLLKDKQERVIFVDCQITKDPDEGIQLLSGLAYLSSDLPESLELFDERDRLVGCVHFVQRLRDSIKVAATAIDTCFTFTLENNSNAQDKN
jgi:hypothetical protein